jgi:LAS superfamily LD-carboxypeptidase LdcB
MFSASSVGDWQNNKTLMRYFEWMKENAHFYGFTNTYQK